jgi:hypothetical protein
LLGAGEKLVQMPPQSIFAFLIIIGFGTLITCMRRTVRLARRLKVT